MKVIEKTAKIWQPETKYQSAPNAEDFIDEDCVIIDEQNQQIVALQIQLNDASHQTRQQIMRKLRFGVKWTTDQNRPARLSGIASANKVFGTLEPNKMRQRFGCKSAALDRDEPILRDLLGVIATESFTELKKIDHYRAENHEKLVTDSIHKDWLLKEAPFTSGVINYSAALPYHRDSGNIVGSWSAMVCMRKNMLGGHLHLPEYDITLGVPNGSLIWFNGQSVWHGVTPMFAQKKDAYRFTVVFYAKRKVSDCLCVADEQIRAAKNAMHSTSPLVKKLKQK